MSSMTAKELFGVGVRLVGLTTVMAFLPDLFQMNLLGAAPGIVAGLILLTRGDLIAALCYPTDKVSNEDWRERIPPKDFRDT